MPPDPLPVTRPDPLADDLRYRAKVFRYGCVANVVVLLLLLTIPAIVVPALVRATGASTPAADEVEIRAVLTGQEAAWNRADLDGFMAGYHCGDDTSFISGGDILKGWDAVRDRYRKSYQADGKEMGKLTFSELQVEGFSPNAATCRGRWQVVTTKETVAGRFTLVLRKFPDGWKVVHDHTSK